jgi:hypothetical protein
MLVERGTASRAVAAAYMQLETGNPAMDIDIESIEFGNDASRVGVVDTVQPHKRRYQCRPKASRSGLLGPGTLIVDASSAIHTPG